MAFIRRISSDLLLYRLFVIRKLYQGLVFLLCFLLAFPDHLFAMMVEGDVLVDTLLSERYSPLATLHARDAVTQQIILQEKERNLPVSIRITTPTPQEVRFEVDTEGRKEHFDFKKGFLFHREFQEVFQEDQSIGFLGALKGLGTFMCLWDGGFALFGSTSEKKKPISLFRTLSIETPGSLLLSNLRFNVLEAFASNITLQGRVAIRKGTIQATAQNPKDAWCHVDTSAVVSLESLDILRGIFLNKGFIKNTRRLNDFAHLSLRDGYNFRKFCGIRLDIKEGGTFINEGHMKNLDLKGRGSFVNHNQLRYVSEINIRHFHNQTVKAIAPKARVTCGISTHVETFLNDENSFYTTQNITIEGTEEASSSSSFINKGELKLYEGPGGDGILRLKNTQGTNQGTLSISALSLENTHFTNQGTISTKTVSLTQSSSFLNDERASFESRSFLTEDTSPTASSSFINQGILRISHPLILKIKEFINRGILSIPNLTVAPSSFFLNDVGASFEVNRITVEGDSTDSSSNPFINKGDIKLRGYTLFDDFECIANLPAYENSSAFETLPTLNLPAFEVESSLHLKNTRFINQGSLSTSQIYLSHASLMNEPYALIHQEGKEGTAFSLEEDSQILNEGTIYTVSNYSYESAFQSLATHNKGFWRHTGHVEFSSRDAPQTIYLNGKIHFRRGSSWNPTTFIIPKGSSLHLEDFSVSHNSRILNHGTLLLDSPSSDHLRGSLNLENTGVVSFRHGQYEFSSFNNTGQIHLSGNWRFRRDYDLFIESEDIIVPVAKEPATTVPKKPFDFLGNWWERSRTSRPLDAQRFKNTGRIFTDGNIDWRVNWGSKDTNPLEMLGGLTPLASPSLLNEPFQETPTSLSAGLLTRDVILGSMIFQDPITIKTTGKVIFTQKTTFLGPVSIQARSIEALEDVSFQGGAALQTQDGITLRGETSVQKGIRVECGGDWAILGPMTGSGKIEGRVGGLLLQEAPVQVEAGVEILTYKYEKRAVLNSSQDVHIKVQENTVLVGGFERGLLETQGPILLRGITEDQPFVNNGTLQGRILETFSGLLNNGHIQGKIHRFTQQKGTRKLINNGILNLKEMGVQEGEYVFNAGVIEIKSFFLKKGQFRSQTSQRAPLGYVNRKGKYVQYAAGSLIAHEKAEILAKNGESFLNEGYLHTKLIEAFSSLINNGHIQGGALHFLGPRGPRKLINTGILDIEEMRAEDHEEILNTGVIDLQRLFLKGGQLISRKGQRAPLEYVNRRGQRVQHTTGSLIASEKMEALPFYEFVDGYTPDFTREDAIRPEVLKTYKPFDVFIEEGLLQTPHLVLQDYGGRFGRYWNPQAFQDIGTPYLYPPEGMLPLLSSFEIRGGTVRTQKLSLQLEHMNMDIGGDSQSLPSLEFEEAQFNIWGEFRNLGTIKHTGTIPLVLNFFPKIVGHISLQGVFDHRGDIQAPHADVSLLGLGIGKGYFKTKNFFYMPYFQKGDRLHGVGMLDPYVGALYRHLLKYRDITALIAPISQRATAAIESERQFQEQKRAEWEATLRAEEVATRQHLESEIARFHAAIAQLTQKRDMQIGWREAQSFDSHRDRVHNRHLLQSGPIYRSPEQKNPYNQRIGEYQAIIATITQEIAALPGQYQAKISQYTEQVGQLLLKVSTERHEQVASATRQVEENRSFQLEDLRRFLGNSAKFEFTIEADTCRYGVCALDLQGLILAKVEADFSSVIDLRTGVDFSQSGIPFVDALSRLAEQLGTRASSSSLVLAESTSPLVRNLAQVFEQLGITLRGGDILAPSIRIGGARAILGARTGIWGVTQNVHSTAQLLALMAWGSLESEIAKISSQTFVKAGSMNVGLLQLDTQLVVGLGGSSQIGRLELLMIPYILRITGSLQVTEHVILAARYLVQFLFGANVQIGSQRSTNIEDVSSEPPPPVIIQAPHVETAADVIVTGGSSLLIDAQSTFFQTGGTLQVTATEKETPPPQVAPPPSSIDTASPQSSDPLPPPQIAISTPGTAVFVGGSLLSDILASVKSSALYQLSPHIFKTQTAVFDVSDGLALRGKTKATQGVYIKTPRMDLRDLNPPFLHTPQVTLSVTESVGVHMPTTVFPSLFVHTEGGLTVTQPLLFQGDALVEAEGSFYNDAFITGQHLLDMRFRDGVNIRHFEQQGHMSCPQMSTGVIQAPVLYVQSTQGDFINQAGDLIGHSLLGVRIAGNLHHQAGAYQTQGEHDRITRYLPGRFISGGVMGVDVGGITYNTASHFLAQDNLYFNSRRGYVGNTRSSTYISDRGSKSSGFMGMNERSWTTYKTDVYTPVVRSAGGFLDITIPEGFFENRGGPIGGEKGLSLFARDTVSLGATVSEARTQMTGSGYFGLSRSSGGATTQQATPTYLYGGTGGISVTSQTSSVLGHGLLYDTQTKASFSAGRNIELKEVKLYNNAWSKSSGIFFSNPVTDALSAFNRGASPLTSLGTLDPLFANIDALTRAQHPMEYVESLGKGILSAIDFSASLARSFNTSSFVPFLSRYADVGIGYHSHTSSDTWTTSVPSQGTSQDLSMQAQNAIILSGGTQLNVISNASWQTPLFQVIAGEDTWQHQEDSNSIKVSYNLLTKQVSVSSTANSHHGSGIMIHPSTIRVGGLSTFDIDRMEVLGSTYQTATATGRIGTLFERGLQSTSQNMSRSASVSGVLGHFNPAYLFGSSPRVNSGSYHQTYQRSQSTARAAFEITDQTPNASGTPPLIIENADLQASTLDVGGVGQVLLWDVKKSDGPVDKSITQTRGIELSRASNYGFIGLHTHDTIQETAQRSVVLGAGSSSGDSASDATALIRDEDSGFDLPVFIPDTQMLSQQFSDIAQALRPTVSSLRQEMEEYERQRKAQEEQEQRQRLEKIKAYTFTGEDLPSSIKDGLTPEERNYFAVIYSNHIRGGKSPQDVQTILERGLVRAILKSTSKLQELTSADPSETIDSQQEAASRSSIPTITIKLPKLTPLQKTLRIVEDAGLALAQIESQYPWLTPVTVSTLQMALLGPTRYIVSEATHAVIGDTVESLKHSLYTYVAQKLEVAEGLVEVTTSCVGMVANIFLSNSKNILKEAKAIAKSVKKREASIDKAVEAFDKAAHRAVRGERTTYKAVHGNSKDYVGDTHIYAMRDNQGVPYKIGQSMQGINKDNNSIRATVQVKKIYRRTGEHYSTEIRRTFPEKAKTLEYETKFIKTFRRLFGDDKLPGNKGSR